MKYIKLYDESEDRNKTLMEICLELEDYGYTIIIKPKVNISHVRHISSIIIEKRVRIDNQVRIDLVRFSEVKEYLLRIKDYLGDNYIDCRCGFFGVVYKKIILSDDVELEDKKLVQISIDYINNGNVKIFN